MKPPKIINKGISKTSAMAINQDEITGKSEKKLHFKNKTKGVLGESIKELNFGKPYSKKIPKRDIIL